MIFKFQSSVHNLISHPFTPLPNCSKPFKFFIDSAGQLPHPGVGAPQPGMGILAMMASVGTIGALPVASQDSSGGLVTSDCMEKFWDL